MSEQDRSEARTHLGRAGRQSRNAAKNVARAAREESSHLTEIVEDAGEEVADTAKRINVRRLSALTGDTGIGFLALSVSMYAGAIAYKQFRNVVHNRGAVVKP